MTDSGEVDSGALYRLIRPTRDCWVDGHLTSRVFRKDGDVGISMLIASERVYEKIIEKWPDYGVCSIEVERLREVPPPDSRTVIETIADRLMRERVISARAVAAICREYQRRMLVVT